MTDYVFELSLQVDYKMKILILIFVLSISPITNSFDILKIILFLVLPSSSTSSTSTFRYNENFVKSVTDSNSTEVKTADNSVAVAKEAQTLQDCMTVLSKKK